MIEGLQSAVSGVQVASQRMDVSAHDVANVNTPGFRESRLEQSEGVPAGVRTSAITRTPNASPNVSGTDLARERVEQLDASNTLSANVATIKTQDRMLGSLLDIFA